MSCVTTSAKNLIFMKGFIVVVKNIHFSMCKKIYISFYLMVTLHDILESLNV